MKHLFNRDYFEYLENFRVDEIHEGYFSIDKQGRLKDAKETDADAYELIMKNKEKLLSFQTPIRFIFSHSALKEGWDNPNIFQICTLRYTKSTISKRQEIGRGLRICVNKDGYRMDVETLGDEFFDVNNLTIIANESYENFAKSLQQEYLENIDRAITFTVENIKGFKLKDKEIDELLANKLVINFAMNGYIDEDFNLTEKIFEDIEKDEFKISNEFKDYKEDIIKLVQKIDASSVIKNAIENEKAKNIKLEKLTPNSNFAKFEELWQKIKFKTTYKIDFDSKELIEKVIQRINKDLEIKKIKIEITLSEQKEKLSLNDEMLEVKKRKALESDINISNIKYDLLGELSRATYLKRETIAKILKGIEKEKFEMFKINPEDFIVKVRDFIEEEKATIFISAINYDVNGVYESEIFTINNFRGTLNEDLIKVKRHIYDYLKYDSKIEKEFAKNLEAGEIIVYAKLPSKFKIPTPAGYYNPDFAILFKKEKTIYFIAETKGSLKSMELKGKEKAKIEYAKKHFEKLSKLTNSEIKYKVVKTFDDLNL